MLYQLANGRVIHLSIEEYLSLSDNDIQDLNGMNIGDYPTSHWHDSVIRNEKKTVIKKEITLDYELDSDEVSPSVTISLDSLTVDEVETINNIEDTTEEN
jgi:hypothetical protein